MADNCESSNYLKRVCSSAGAGGGGTVPPVEAGGEAGDLSDLVNGREGRINDERITLFKSVGLAVWDLIVASAVVRAGSR